MSLQVSRILHAGYMFEHEGIRLLFDPIFENPFSVNCYAFPPVSFDMKAVESLSIHGIFISHYHDDHFSLESLNLLNKDTPVFMFTIFPELLGLLRELGFKNVSSLQLEETVSIHGFQVTPLEALDADVDCIFHIQASGFHVLNVVDSWIGPQTFQNLLKVPRWDLILWPFQSMQEIKAISPSSELDPHVQELPFEWLEQLQLLNPRVIVPSSCQFQFEDWSDLNDIFFPISYESFNLQIAQVIPETQCLRLDPGESVSLTSFGVVPTNRIYWIQLKTLENLDYVFQPDADRLAVSEIAKRIAALSELQKEQVKDFCTRQLLIEYQKHQNQDYEVEPQWFWLLMTYDEFGAATLYPFKIDGPTLTLELDLQLEAEAEPEKKIRPLYWKTEICEAKLWNALYEGESLSSLYIRISPHEKEDPLLDPLLVSLYTGKVGSYQKAQLHRIRSAQETLKSFR